MFAKPLIAGLLATFALAAPQQAAAGSLLKALKARAENEAARVVETGHILPAGLPEGYENYGIWDFKLESFERGADDNWQVVVAVRNASHDRLGMVASEIKLYLLAADGETHQNWGDLYKPDITGSAAGLEPVNGTLWLEPGDITRVRLRFDESRSIVPNRLRIQSTGAGSVTRTFPVATESVR